MAVVLPAAAQEGESAAQSAPEAASGRSDKALVVARRHMIVAAHPLAAEAGRDILRAGGNAVDAAIAAAFVLGVVEPQSSGVGGGGFLLNYDRRRHAISAWDGRETAPIAAKPERFLISEGTISGKPRPFMDAVGSGLSVGVPGLVAMLAAAHRAHGRLAWARLLAPAIRIAGEGFDISPRLATLIAADPLLPASASARRYFFNADGSPKRVGQRLVNAQLAGVLRGIAARGPQAFYRGDIASDIAAAVQDASDPRRTAGDLTEFDLAAYVPKRRTAVCGAYRSFRVCGMPPPSSGGLSVAQLLALLERFPMREYGPDSVEAVHLFAEAGRLVYADRDRYVADPDSVDVPAAQMLDRAYLARRSALIDLSRSMGRAAPGELPLQSAAKSAGADLSPELPATTHVSVVDAAGNAVALTASIEAAFGSRIMVRGFLLNNQLTDFSFMPAAANGVAPGKRPRSSMAPTLVFEDRAPNARRPHANPAGTLRWVLGSPGGPLIINYVAKTLVGLIDWQLDAQAATALPNRGNRNRATELEAGTAVEALAPRLEALGHVVRIESQTSGVHVIAVARGGDARLSGGADPRREGVALGD